MNVKKYFLSFNITMMPKIEYTSQHYRFPLANYHLLAVHYLPPHPQGRPMKNVWSGNYWSYLYSLKIILLKQNLNVANWLAYCICTRSRWRCWVGRSYSLSTFGVSQTFYNQFEFLFVAFSRFHHLYNQFNLVYNLK